MILAFPGYLHLYFLLMNGFKLGDLHKADQLGMIVGRELYPTV